MLIDDKINSYLRSCLTHCAHFSPYYSEQLWAKKMRAGKKVRLHNVPVTPRDAVRQNPARFYLDRPNPAAGKIVTTYTSGSTGEPMTVKSTSLSRRINTEENSRMRQGWWKNEDVTTGLILKAPSEDKPLGMLEKVSPKPRHPDWTLHSLDAQTGLETILELQPEYLCAYPSLVYEILKLAERAKLDLSLRYLSTAAESVGEELLEIAENKFGCKLYDAYGSIETGIIAARCAVCKEYHPAEGHMVVEILGKNGKPVKHGETGNVVVTPLFNSAMPLVRYSIGDLATLSANSCPNSKMSISRIEGREIHLFRTASGRRFTPRIPPQILTCLGLKQYKLVQTAINEVEFYYVPFEADTKIEQQFAQKLVDEYLDPSLFVVPVAMPHLPRLKSGKYLWHETRLEN